MSVCEYCQQAYQGKRPGHFGSDPRCGFDGNSLFKSDNWQCATLNTLRSCIERYGYWLRKDMQQASIGVLTIPEHDGWFEDEEDSEVKTGYIVMTWYKSRGATGNAVVMWDDHEVAPLNFATAKFVIEQYREGETNMPTGSDSYLWQSNWKRCLAWSESLALSQRGR